jgi:endonuclease YncB( thermonuclease family)
VLLAASLFFGIGAERQRRQSIPKEVALSTGDLVHLKQVVDGDTLLVKSDADETMTIRLLGVKAFPTKPDKDPVSQFGKAAMSELERTLRDRPMRVMLHSTPKDRHGRFLAELFADDQNVSLKLVEKGLALVYSAFPFPSMSLYLHEQELARSERRGLWAVPEVAMRADLLIRQWSKEKQ